ncbi:MAG: hypothetical protein WCB31_10365 [Nitrososphaeraceae archaeon]
MVKRTIRKYGKPLQILTDHGSQFYNSHSKLKSDFNLFWTQTYIQHPMGIIVKPLSPGRLKGGIAHMM